MRFDWGLQAGALYLFPFKSLLMYLLMRNRLFSETLSFDS
jgi:hypothetical protein